MKGWLRLSAGLAYRLIGSSDGMEERLRGLSGSFAVQIGGGS